jgi:hypothetical protein
VKHPNFGHPTGDLERFGQHAFGSLTMEPAMNHSIYTADRATHLKVVVSVLLTGITIMAAALIARLPHTEVSTQAMTTLRVYKAHPGHALTEMAPIAKHPI